MVKIKLNLTKLDKKRFFKGEKGTYADLVLIDYKDGPKYDNDGFVKQDCTKEEREAKVEMPIIGSFRYIGGKPSGAAKPALVEPAAPADDDTDSSDVPF